jgi:hypothetical protein
VGLNLTCKRSNFWFIVALDLWLVGCRSGVASIISSAHVQLNPPEPTIHPTSPNQCRILLLYLSLALTLQPSPAAAASPPPHPHPSPVLLFLLPRRIQPPSITSRSYMPPPPPPHSCSHYFFQQSRRRIQTSSIFFARFFKRSCMQCALRVWASTARCCRHRKAVVLVRIQASDQQLPQSQFKTETLNVCRARLTL